MTNKYALFNIIKHAGEPQEGRLPDGKKVFRLTEITEFETLLDGTRKSHTYKCAPYDNHFIYRVPSGIIGPAYCCSCGSMAVLTGSKSYASLGSPQGRLWVCHVHTMTGKHADGSS